MRRMRIPLIIVLSISVLGFVLGTFLDFNLSSAIADRNNMFAITLSVLGPVLGFSGLTFIFGGLIPKGLDKNTHIVLRIILLVAAVGAYGFCIYMAGKEIFGGHGFYGAAKKWVGYPIAAVPLGAAEVLGYFAMKDSDNKNAWIVLAIAAGVCFMALVPGTTLIKEIFHRPRFRSVIETEGLDFYPWYRRCSNYKDLMAAFGLASEEFKSFPSGHTCEASILLTAAAFVPLANRKYERFQYLAFGIAGAFVLIVALGRIMAAAHYLSDVSMALMLMMVFALIANEIVLRLKFFQQEPAQTAE